MPTKTSIASLLLVVGLSPLSGCWFTQNQSATGEYARQVMVAQTRAAAVETSLAATEQRLEQLEETLRAQGASQAKRLENLDEVNREVNRLRGEIEVMRFELDELKRAWDDSSMDFERRQLHDELRLQQVERLLGVKPPPPPSIDGTTPCSPGAPGCPPATAEVPGPTEAEAPIPETLEGKLTLAVEHMKEGRGAAARVVLDQAIKAHPSDPRVAEARYRIGESWLNESNWGKAVNSFQAVVDNHPRSDWAAWAMLGQGDAFAGKGEPANARLFYDEVVKLYKTSEAAKEAKKRPR